MDGDFDFWIGLGWDGGFCFFLVLSLSFGGFLEAGWLLGYLILLYFTLLSVWVRYYFVLFGFVLFSRRLLNGYSLTGSGRMYDLILRLSTYTDSRRGSDGLTCLIVGQACFT